MTKNIRSRGEDIRGYILLNIANDGLAAKVCERFNITRQAANRHLKNLVTEGAIVAEGHTVNRSYKLAKTFSKLFTYEIADGLQEDLIWRADVLPVIGAIPENVLQIWQWAFTEMFNNAIDHSEGTRIIVKIEKTALYTEIMVNDDGVGIFKKIQNALGLHDERQAMFELSKGKLTTDAANHSGQGIFFTSRMVNDFRLLSRGVYFSHEMGRDHDWMIETESSADGTAVFMKVDNHTARTVKKTLAKFSVGKSYSFNKTIVPVDLARYGSDQLVSRSQAKRVLARVDLFTQVLFDFTGIELIGQAFADQIFRVYANEHPEIQLIPMHASKEIMGVIQASIRAGRPGFKKKD